MYMENSRLKWIMVDGIDNDGHRGIIPNVIGQY
jgi:hypothetical protein